MKYSVQETSCPGRYASIERVTIRFSNEDLDRIYGDTLDITSLFADDEGRNVIAPDPISWLKHTLVHHLVVTGTATEEPRRVPDLVEKLSFTWRNSHGQPRTLRTSDKFESALDEAVAEHQTDFIITAHSDDLYFDPTNTNGNFNPLNLDLIAANPTLVGRNQPSTQSTSLANLGAKGTQTTRLFSLSSVAATAYRLTAISPVVRKRISLLVALAMVALAVTFRLWSPILIRELILKRTMQRNRYLERTDIPDKCPSFESIAHRSVKNFDYNKFSGLWYSFAHNEPTQPLKGQCRCDRFQWNLAKEPQSLHDSGLLGSTTDNSRYFEERLDLICELNKGYAIPISMELEGKTNTKSYNSSMHEGAPKSGAPLIPSHVVWISPDYSSCIRYSCQENYLGAPLFHSLQIWTREPIKHGTRAGSLKRKALLKQAHSLLSFEEQYMDFTEHDNCEMLPNIIL